MEKVYEDAKQMLEREVQDIAIRGAVSVEDIALMSRLLDNLKDMSIIVAMECVYSSYSGLSLTIEFKMESNLWVRSFRSIILID